MGSCSCFLSADSCTMSNVLFGDTVAIHVPFGDAAVVAECAVEAVLLAMFTAHVHTQVCGVGHDQPAVHARGAGRLLGPALFFLPGVGCGSSTFSPSASSSRAASTASSACR